MCRESTHRLATEYGKNDVNKRQRDEEKWFEAKRNHCLFTNINIKCLNKPYCCCALDMCDHPLCGTQLTNGSNLNSFMVNSCLAITRREKKRALKEILTGLTNRIGVCVCAKCVRYLSVCL